MAAGQATLLHMIRFFFITVLWLSITISSAQSITSEGLEIEADTVEWIEKTGELSFRGGIRIQWGDIELRCLRMKAQRGPKGELSDVLAIGEVVVTAPSWSARAGQARYRKDADTLTLEEAPKIHRDGVRLAGSRIILHLASQRLVVESAKGKIPAPTEVLGLTTETEGE